MKEPTIISEIVLEKIKTGVALEVSQSFLDTSKVECVEDYLARALVLRLRSYLWGKEVSRSVESTQKFSATWWDHFKVTYFPVWLYRRYPSQFVTVDTVIKHYHTCPHLNLAPEESHLYFLSASDCERIGTELKTK